MSMQRILLYGLILVLLTAPLPFGSVQPGPTAALVVALLGLGVLWILWRSRCGLAPLPWRDPLLAAGALFALVGIVQLVPVPRSLLQTISPGAVELRDRYEPLPHTAATGGGGHESPRPISMYPWATRQATLRLLAYLVAALITVDLVSVGSARGPLVIALAASGGFQALYGLSEYFTDHQQIFGYVKRYYTDVATGTYINRNHFAGYLEMTLPLAIALAGASLSRLRSRGGATLWQRLASIPGRPLFIAAGLLLLALTMAIALVCSRSRMGIASALLSLVVVGLVLFWRGRGRGFAIAALAVVGVTLLLFSQGGAGVPVVGRFLSTPEEFGGALGRTAIWSQTAGMIAAFPLAGVGLGAFRHVFPVFRTGGAGISLDHAHNDYLELAAEAGAIGCLAAIAGVGLVIVATARTYRGARRADRGGPLVFATLAGVVGIMLHSLTDFNLAIPANALTFAVVVGTAIAALRAPAIAPVAPAATSRLRPSWIWAPVAGLGAIALLAVAPILTDAEGAGGSSGIAPPGGDLAAGFGNGPRIGRGPAAGARLTFLLDGDNAERLFRAATAVGGPAMTDLEALSRAQAEGHATSLEAAGYVGERLRRATALQAQGLRRLPTSPEGHIGLGQFGIAACAATALAGAERPGCLRAPIDELRAALSLSPMGARTHAHVARLLIGAWPILDAAERSRCRPLIERAVAMNPEDHDLPQAWMAVRDGAAAAPAEGI